MPTPNRTRWLKRFRPPVLFLLVGLVLLFGTPFLTPYLDLGETVRGVIGILGRICVVIAIGWAIGTVVDAFLKRQIAGLKLDQFDNLSARKTATRLDVARRIWIVLTGLITIAAALTMIPGVRQIGISLFASAGIAGLALGLAARPVLSNLIAGIQIAFTQPIRIDDAVVVEGEWGWIEEIGLFYVVIKVWDWRRLVVPLSYFIERPFQNWTRQSASIIGSVFWNLDYRTPVGAVREKLKEICEGTQLWDGNVVNLQVSDTTERTIQIRALASARTSPEAWDLRCLIREEMVSWLQETYPHALPRFRVEQSEMEPFKAPAGADFEPDTSLTKGKSAD
ncbi:MAG: mechanosensitive ion channel family protein [Hyphomonadaceae bacterium]|nr:mechanosensitive ion channel family protein [Hyphomonadaceae bacterium]